MRKFIGFGGFPVVMFIVSEIGNTVELWNFGLWPRIVFCAIVGTILNYIFSKMLPKQQPKEDNPESTP